MVLSEGDLVTLDCGKYSVVCEYEEDGVKYFMLTNEEKDDDIKVGFVKDDKFHEIEEKEVVDYLLANFYEILEPLIPEVLREDDAE